MKLCLFIFLITTVIVSNSYAGLFGNAFNRARTSGAGRTLHRLVQNSKTANVAKPSSTGVSSTSRTGQGAGMITKIGGNVIKPPVKTPQRMRSYRSIAKQYIESQSQQQAAQTAETITFNKKDLTELAELIAHHHQTAPVRKTALITWSRVMNGLAFTYAAYILTGELNELHEKALQVLAEGHNDDVLSGLDIAQAIADILNKKTKPMERARLLGALIKTFKNMKEIYAEKFEKEIDSAVEYIETNRAYYVQKLNEWYEVLGFFKDLGMDIKDYKIKVDKSAGIKIKNDPFAKDYKGSEYAFRVVPK